MRRMKIKKFLSALPLTTVSLLFWGISLSFNLQTGYDWGNGQWVNIATYMALALAGDMTKAVMAAKLPAELRSRQLFQASVSLLILSLCVVLSLYAAFAQRTKALEGVRTQQAEARKVRLQAFATLASLKQQWKTADKARDLETLKSELAAARAHRRYRTSEGCTNATAPASVALCQRITNLQAEKALRIRAGRLKVRLQAAEARAAALPAIAATTDPAAGAIRDVLVSLGMNKHLEAVTVSGWIMIALTLMVETLSTLLPMKMSRVSTPPAKRPDVPEKVIVPADGRTLSRHEALDWLRHRAREDERVRKIDEDEDSVTILATAEKLAKIWGRPKSTAAEWVTNWHIDGLIEKHVTSKGTRITVL